VRALLLSASDSDGGSPRAAYRLHRSLLEVGCESAVLAVDKKTADRRVFSATRHASLNRWRVKLDRSFMLLGRAGWHKPREAFSFQYFGIRLAGLINRWEADVLNIHWAPNGFLRIEDLALVTKPIVWTLHNMHPFTGGCHYSGDCRGYESDCRGCPILGLHLPFLDAAWVLRRKHRWYPKGTAVISPSRWMNECAQASSVFRGSSFYTIPNSVDTDLFRPGSKAQARRALGIRPDARFVILFGASNAVEDRRKGYQLVRAALDHLRRRSAADGIELLVFGNSRSGPEATAGVPTVFLGHIREDSALATAYQAADLFLLPSLEDNLPNTMLEAMACALPCAGNCVGGMPDLIADGVNGFLNRSNSAEGLAETLLRAIACGDKLAELGQNARMTVLEKCAPAAQASAYAEVFRTCVRNR